MKLSNGTDLTNTTWQGAAYLTGMEPTDVAGLPGVESDVKFKETKRSVNFLPMVALLSKDIIKRGEWKKDLPDGYHSLGLDDSYFHLDTIKRFARIDQNLFSNIKGEILKSILENTDQNFCKSVFESVKKSNLIFESNKW